MRALVTGANSLIGVGIAHRLLAEGHTVVAFDLERSRVPTGCEFVSGDVRDFEALTSAASGCDAGIHLAALAGENPPADVLSVNVVGAAGFLHAARSAGFTCAVVTSSAPVHLRASPADQGPILRTGEDADHIYDLSKALQEIVARDFHAHGLACLTLRLGHVVDGRDNVTLDERVPLSGETYCRGGWVDIEDAVSACVAALKVVPDPDGFEVLGVVGSASARKRFDVARTERRLDMRMSFDFAEFEAAPP